jgi:uncharacterized membrane protein
LNAVPRAHRPALPGLVVLLLSLAYIVFFSVYSLQRHATLNSYAADLSFIDQPMWNTLHGHLLERTMGDRQVSRVAEHLEPIIIPIASVFYLWDDVRAILIVQTIALALGALPVYWIARRAFAARPDGPTSAPAWWVRWLPLPFVVAYLMFPALQAANVADFHADPFIVAPLLFAFWYATERRYLAMWVWAVVGLLVKENLPLLIFMLGLFLAMFGGKGTTVAETRIETRTRRLHGAALMLASLAWFYVATFLIVAPLARQVYGTEGPIYLAHRYTWLSDGPAGIWAMLTEPERLRYLVELLAPVGWLALLAPEYLLLGLPVLVANSISDFPGQYSGQQHYSAPLVPVFAIAAIYGVRRLVGFAAPLTPFSPSPRIGRGGWGVRGAVVLACAAWLLAWSMGYHYLRGWTPLSRDYSWPQLTAHHQLLQRFADQIPADAVVATTPPLHPHLAHRWKIYLYPTVADADYVLLDLASRTDAHPNDVRKTFEDLVDAKHFGILDAADGYVLLARNGGGATGKQALPDEFFSFVRAGDRQPEHPVRVDFIASADGQPMLRLLGYDVLDDPAWQQTGVRLYWQALAPLSVGTTLWPFFFDDTGLVIEDTSQRPMVAPIWYPPAQWRPSETVMTETLPWTLGAQFNLGVAVLGPERPQDTGAGSGLDNTARRLLVGYADPAAVPFQGRSWVQVGTFRRAGHYLTPDSAGAALSSVDVTFAGDIHLVGYRYRVSSDAISVVLAWQPGQPIARDYTVFVHLLTAEGVIVAQSDAQPHWAATWPTSRWSPGEVVFDGHRLVLPPDAPAGPYELRVGLYHWQTLERLPVLDANGQPVADYASLGLTPVP